MIKYDEEKLRAHLLSGKEQVALLWQYNNEGQKIYPYLSKSKSGKKGFNISLTGRSAKGTYLPVSFSEFVEGIVNKTFPEEATVRMNILGSLAGNAWLIRNLNIENEFYEKVKLCETKVDMGETEKLEKFNIELEKSVDAATKLSSKELDEKIIQYSAIPEKVEVLTTIFKRNPYVIAKRLEIANGMCENCKQPAPFNRKSDNTPYLEVHHRTFLSDGGEDTVENTIALCPNCHKKIHFGI